MRQIRKWLIPGIFFFALGVFTTAMVERVHGAADDLYEQLRPLMESINFIQSYYVDADKTGSKELVNGAINGMLGTLDPFSAYMDPQAYKDMQDETEGTFGGLGIEIAIKNNQLTVMSPIDGTPAYRAGIKSGDVIARINGETTDGLPLNDAVHKLRGLKGTSVTISIMREGFKAFKDIAIVRDIIKIINVRSFMLEDRVGYVRLAQFMGKECGDDFRRALKDLQGKKARALILDLRNNPGGLLQLAKVISEQFVPKGKLIVSTDGRIKDQNIKYVSENNDNWKKPLVVLVNGGSASASEIVAGAIQDQGLGVIVGTKSFGKGSVQTVLSISNGKAALRLTTAKYLTPKGRVIHGKGIEPDVVAEEDVYSSQMTTMVGDEDFAHFIKGYLVEHPDFSLTATARSGDVKVSENSWSHLKPESREDKLMKDFAKYCEDKVRQYNDNQFWVDHERILNELKKEVARRSGGEDEARKVGLQGDPQVRRALDVLKIAEIYKKKAGE